MTLRTRHFLEALLVATVSCLVAAPSANAAVAIPIPPTGAGFVTTEGWLSPPAFKAKGTNGFRIFVVGTDRHPGDLDVVTLYAWRGDQQVSYRVSGTVERNFVRAKFGGLGSIKLSFKPSKGTVLRPQPGGCTRVRVRKGDFRGRLRFRGENGYTRVNTRRGSSTGPPTRFPPCSPNHVATGPPNIDGYKLSEGLLPVTRFWASKATPDSPALAQATTYQKSADMEVLREVSATAPSTALAYDTSSVSLTLAGSITGSASFAVQRSPCEVQGLPSGSLTVGMPGLGSIDLAGSGFRYQLTVPGVQPTGGNCPG